MFYEARSGVVLTDQDFDQYDFQIALVRYEPKRTCPGVVTECYCVEILTEPNERRWQNTRLLDSFRSYDEAAGYLAKLEELSAAVALYRKRKAAKLASVPR